MLDQPATLRAPIRPDTGRPRLDFQEHLADLEASGLLVRIDRPINKDTELHPLVRLAIHRRHSRRASAARSCSPMWSIRKGRQYDMPVVVGAIAASAEIYALGMGSRSRRSAKPGWRRSRNPIAPITVPSPPCQEVVITGDELRSPAAG